MRNRERVTADLSLPDPMDEFELEPLAELHLRLHGSHPPAYRVEVTIRIVSTVVFRPETFDE